MEINTENNNLEIEEFRNKHQTIRNIIDNGTSHRTVLSTIDFGPNAQV